MIATHLQSRGWSFRSGVWVSPAGNTFGSLDAAVRWQQVLDAAVGASKKKRTTKGRK